MEISVRSISRARTGYVYIRQSTAYQVMANTESTMRQYALKERMAALGWDSSLVKVIDTDLGIFGTKADNREGFQELMADVANGLVGAVACIEASRLSRRSSRLDNLALLDQNRTQFKSDGSRNTPPREGNTLLQGIC